MAQTFKTYDGVEVSTEAGVWACYKSGYSDIHKRIDRPLRLTGIREGDKEYNVLYFSTEEACQAYIDSMNEVKQQFCPNTDINPHLGELINECRTPKPKLPVISVSMYNQAGEKIISSEVCEFETGVHHGGLKNDMHHPIFEFTNETGKPITIKEGQRIAWKDGRVKLFDAPTIPNPDIHSAQMFGNPPFSVSAKALKEYDEWKEEMHRHLVLCQFSEAYKIPINDILQFIINQKSK